MRAREIRDLNHELAAANERFRLLIGSVQDYGIFMLDPQGLVEGYQRSSESNLPKPWLPYSIT